MLRILRDLGGYTEFMNKEGIKKKLKILETMLKEEKTPSTLSNLKSLETFLSKYVQDTKPSCWINS